MSLRLIREPGRIMLVWHSGAETGGDGMGLFDRLWKSRVRKLLEELLDEFGDRLVATVLRDSAEWEQSVIRTCRPSDWTHAPAAVQAADQEAIKWAVEQTGAKYRRELASGLERYVARKLADVIDKAGL